MYISTNEDILSFIDKYYDYKYLYTEVYKDEFDEHFCDQHD